MAEDDPHLERMTTVSTPCVNVCFIDPRDGLCAGCARTPDEIFQWLDLDEPARQAIMSAAPSRRGKVPPSTEV